MSEARPEKRPRLSDEVAESIEHNSAVPLFTKSDPWFDDGNIVLSCGNTGFRVHQGVLALHSPVFKDMFTVGNPGGVLFEGCGVVALTDDADDMRHLLNAMYLIEDGSGRERSMEMLSSILRMSTKYVVDRFRKQVIQRLSSMFPSTLAKYTAAVRDRRISAKFDPVAAVQLSLDCDVPSILPTALYLCIIKEEKTSAVLHELCQTVHRDNLMPQSQPAYHRILFEKRLRELLDGVFEAYDQDKIWAHAAGDKWACRKSISCHGLRRNAKRRVETAFRALPSEDIFVGDIAVPSLQQGSLGGVCDHCLSELATHQHHFRAAIWSILPQACGWDNWAAVGTVVPRSMEG